MGGDMYKKLLVRYGLLCLPFVLGVSLYCLSIFNIYSSMLFFVGGYVAIKNLCDYRKIGRNIRLINKKRDNLCNVDKIVDKKDGCNNKSINYSSIDNIPGIKRVRVYKRVRRKY